MARLLYLGGADAVLHVTTNPLAFKPGEVTEVPDAVVPFLETIQGFAFRLLDPEPPTGEALPVETPEAEAPAPQPAPKPRKKKGS